jgi:hypothetical protein
MPGRTVNKPAELACELIRLSLFSFFVLVILSERPGKLAQYFLLLRGKIGRRLNGDLYKLVSSPAAV